MTRKLHTEVRQEQIVEAALAVIAQEGLRRLNVARVPRQVGLTGDSTLRDTGAT